MSKSTKKKIKRGAWFYAVRGSYLPATWQAWSLYFIASFYILAPFIVAIKDQDVSIVYTLTGFVTRILLVGVTLTWLAQKKT
jgi:hypothetical protein